MREKTRIRNERVKAYHENHSLSECAAAFGLSEITVKHICAEHGIHHNQYTKNPSDSLAKVKEIISVYGFEYIDGYTDRDHSVRVCCKICGREQDRSYQSFRTGIVKCSFCLRRKKDEIKQRKFREKENKRLQARLEQEKRSREKEEEKIKRLTHICVVCGKVFVGSSIRSRYCSSDCQQAGTSALHEARKRIRDKRISDGDRGISIRGLIERDGDSCYLCGKQIDLNDFCIENGYFIAGNRYPSIEHVVPLVKGGEHSWNNVRLACRLCNSRKGAAVGPAAMPPMR